jgi:hypothetical protein
MKKNTVEGQWLLDGKFEERTDIRTWVTEEMKILGITSDDKTIV